MKSVFVSLRTRMTVYILLLTTIIFVGITAVVYLNMASDLEDKTERYATLLLENMRGKAEGRLRNVERTLQAHIPNWQKNLQHPEAMMGVVEEMVRSNALLMSGSLIFRPGYYDAPYAYLMEHVIQHPDGRVEHRHLGGDSTYNYTNQYWYDYVLEKKNGFWGEPYIDKGAGNIATVSYAQPLYDDHDQLIAIFTADVQLSNLEERVEDMRPYPGSYSFILSDEGRFVIHPQANKDSIQNYRSMAQLTDEPNLIKICERMLKDETGTIVTHIDGQKKIAVFAPMERTGWAVCTLIPYESVAKDLGDITIWLGVFMAIGLLFLGTFTYYTIRASLRPLDSLRDSAVEISKGNFNVELPQMDHKDEVANLRDTFKTMQVDLKKYARQLTDETRQKQAIDSELHLARRIQMEQILTDFQLPSAYAGASLYASIHPAREVGGDLYDYLLRDDKLFFAIGDVAGKGIPAAVMMSLTLTLFRISATKNDLPCQIVKEMNKGIFLSNTSDMFITFLCGTLDLRTGQMRICSAGHNPPICVSPKGQGSMLSVEPNLPLGTEQGFEYKCDEFQLPKGSTLLLYTDGLTEAMDAEGNLFGEQRAIQLAETCADKDAQQTLNAIEGAVKEFVAGALPNDDLTLMAIKY